MGVLTGPPGARPTKAATLCSPIHFGGGSITGSGSYRSVVERAASSSAYGISSTYTPGVRYVTTVLGKLVWVLHASQSRPGQRRGQANPGPPAVYSWEPSFDLRPPTRGGRRSHRYRGHRPRSRA